MKVELGGIPETLLITVRARAEETLRSDSLLSDPFAVDILKQVNLGKMHQKKVAQSSQVGVVIRTKIFDRIATEFISQNPEGIIVALGCGLDARYERLKLSCSHWYDLDVAEAIEIRKRFFQESENYKMISRSMLDISWMAEIPTDKPLLVISEGVFMYFNGEVLKALTKELFHRFPQAEMAFDTIPPFLVKRANLHSEVKKYNAQFLWAVDRPEELKQWDSRIDIIKTYYYADYNPERWSLFMRLFCLIPKLRRGNKVIHIRQT